MKIDSIGCQTNRLTSDDTLAIVTGFIKKKKSEREREGENERTNKMVRIAIVIVIYTFARVGRA